MAGLFKVGKRVRLTRAAFKQLVGTRTFSSDELYDLVRGGIVMSVSGGDGEGPVIVLIERDGRPRKLKVAQQYLWFT